MAEVQPLVRLAENDLGAQRVAGQPERVDLDAPHCRAARLDGASDVPWRDAMAGDTHPAKPLGQLARCTTGHVGLVGAGVVDHLERWQMMRGQQGAVLQERRHHREIPGRDYPDTPLARPQVDLRVVCLSQS